MIVSIPSVYLSFVISSVVNLGYFLWKVTWSPYVLKEQMLGFISYSIFLFSNSFISAFISVNSFLLLFKRKFCCSSNILSYMFISLIFILSCISLYIQINKEKETPKSNSVPVAVSCHCPHLPILIRNVEVEREANSKERCAGRFCLFRRNPQVQGEESQFPEHTPHDSRTPSPLAFPVHCTHSFGGIMVQHSNPITKSWEPKSRPSGKRTGRPRSHSTQWDMQE